MKHIVKNDDGNTKIKNNNIINHQSIFYTNLPTGLINKNAEK